MRFFTGVLLSLFLAGACIPKSDTPVAYPEEFDKQAYAIQLKHDRDSIEKRKSGMVEHQTAQITSELSEELPEEKEFQTVKSDLKAVTDSIPLVIAYGKAVSDTLIRPGQSYVFSFDTDTAKSLRLKAEGISDSVRLKISSVQGPEIEATGPFSNPVRIELEERGVWHVTVTESENENYSGPIRFEVKLGW